jgi:hypothetical protein
MSVDAPHDVETRARKIRRIFDAHAGDGIPNLPFDVVVTHVLREENLPDPADLSRIRGVSRGMCDAVDATGRRIEELGEYHDVHRGCLTTLRCLQRRGLLKYQESLCQSAARSGQLEELKALRAENYPWNAWACAFAAKGGHLRVLQWARENGCRWAKMTCLCAAEGGHLNLLKWAHENGCPWDARTCAVAAKYGKFEVLQWAHGNGCPLDAKTCLIAATGGHVAVVRALIEIGIDVNKAGGDGARPLYIAAQQGHEAVVRALIEAGADVNTATGNGMTPLCFAAQKGHAVLILRDAGAV